MRPLEKAGAVCATDRELLAEVKDAIRRLMPSGEVLLYGSTARGTRTPESDYDLLALTDRPMSTEEEEAIWDALFDVEMERGAAISLQFCSREEWDRRRNMPFYAQVDRDGVVL